MSDERSSLSRRKRKGRDRRRVMGITLEIPSNVVCLQLTKKYAAIIDDVDLTGCEVGDRIVLSPRQARLLIAEGWAVPVEKARARTHPAQPALAADRPRPLPRRRLRR